VRRVKRGRSPKAFYVPVRMSEVEYKMLDRLREFWSKRGGCSRSEAVRRCIVYTYIKFLKGEEISAETLEREYLKLVGRWHE
jgi:metal-responsive CopG/Arc/MetJ family transcriptional regulator